MAQSASTKTALPDHWAPLSLPHPKSSRQPQKERYQAIMHAGLSLPPTLLTIFQNLPWQCTSPLPHLAHHRRPPISTPQMWHAATLNWQIPCCQFNLLDFQSYSEEINIYRPNVNCRSESTLQLHFPLLRSKWLPVVNMNFSGDFHLCKKKQLHVGGLSGV